MAEFLAPRARSATTAVGTAYCVWPGIGAVGAAVLSIAFFDESLTIARVGCIALIVCGILGPKLLGDESAA